MKKKICIILACVIVAITAVSVPTIAAGENNNTVTAEATEEVVTTMVTTTEEATTETTTETTTTEVVEEEQESTTEEYSESTTEETADDDAGYYDGVKLEYSETYDITPNRLTRSGGVNYYNGNRETWYSQNVLPGGGLSIPGRHVADDGTVRDGDGYICIAADPSYMSYGSRTMTSLGPAKVYDSGCAYGTVDIYTSW